MWVGSSEGFIQVIFRKEEMMDGIISQRRLKRVYSKTFGCLGRSEATLEKRGKLKAGINKISWMRSKQAVTTRHTQYSVCCRRQAHS